MKHLLVSLLLASPVAAETAHDFAFPSIDGGEVALEEFAGAPVLVVNTASMCAFTPQYGGLQALFDQYRTAGLVVLAVPSDDFGGQEHATEADVKDFCEVNFDLDLPMTTIQKVKGPAAHPFYQWAEDQGVRPKWNFHKILIDGNGRIAAEFSSVVKPTSQRIVTEIEALLPTN